MVVDDPDAPGGTYVHWVVIDIALSSGASLDDALDQISDHAASSGTLTAPY